VINVRNVAYRVAKSAFQYENIVLEGFTSNSYRTKMVPNRGAAFCRADRPKEARHAQALAADRLCRRGDGPDRASSRAAPGGRRTRRGGTAAASHRQQDAEDAGQGGSAGVTPRRPGGILPGAT